MRFPLALLAVSLLPSAHAQTTSRERLSGRSSEELLVLAMREGALLRGGYGRTRLLIEGGCALLAAGREPEALAALEALGDDLSAHELRAAIARARADRGDLVAAYQLLPARDLRWWREELEDRARCAAVQAAPLPDALARASAIVNPGARSGAQLDVARRFVDAGDPTSALTAVDRAAESLLATKPADGSSSVGAVAQAWTALGRGGAAQALVDAMARRVPEIVNLDLRGESLCDLAVAQASLGHGLLADKLFDDARAAARATTNGGWQTLQVIAAAQARWDRPGALATAAEAGTDGAALGAGFAWLERGQVEEALAVALQAEGWASSRVGSNDDLKCRLAEHFAEAGDVPRALEVAGRIYGGSWRAAAFLSVARVQALDGDRDGAAATVRRTSTLIANRRRGRTPEETLPPDHPSRFVFEDPSRWAIDYEFDGTVGSGASTLSHCAIRTLCTSALRLRLALGWTGGAGFAKAFDGCGDVVRRLAALHGKLGARSDAEDWIDRLVDPETRAWAILGLSEGSQE